MSERSSARMRCRVSDHFGALDEFFSNLKFGIAPERISEINTSPGAMETVFGSAIAIVI